MERNAFGVLDNYEFMRLTQNGRDRQRIIGIYLRAQNTIQFNILFAVNFNPFSLFSVHRFETQRLHCICCCYSLE